MVKGRFVILIISLLFSAIAFGQNFVYDAQDHNIAKEPLLTVLDGRILPETSLMWSDAFYTVRKNIIFKGFSTSRFDVEYRLIDGSLYVGESEFSDDILYTLQDSKIYKGDSSYFIDLLYSFDGKRLYKGESKSNLDLILEFTQIPSPSELFAVLFTLELL